VGDPPRAIENMTSFPFINLFMGREVCDNVSDPTKEGNQAKLFNSFTLRMECFLKEANNIPLAQDNFLGDIQKYFGNNYYIPLTGTRTVFNCIYAGSSPFGMLENIPNVCGIDVDLKIYYRQLLTDPTTLA
jgi:hypothetical protein